MYNIYQNFLPIYSTTSFIDVDYFSVLDPPEQSDTNPFRSLHHPSNFIGLGYVTVPSSLIQAILVVGDGFVPDPLSTFTLAHLLITIFKIY